MTTTWGCGASGEWQVAHVYYYHFVTDVLPRLLWHVVDDPDWSADDEALVFFDTSPSYVAAIHLSA